RRVSGRYALHHADAGATFGLCANRRERTGHRGDLRAAGWAAAGDRAGGRTRPATVAGSNAGAPQDAAGWAPDTGGRPARPARAAADDTGDDRLELRPAQPGGTDPLPTAGGVRGRLDGGGRRSSVWRLEIGD